MQDSMESSLTVRTLGQDPGRGLVDVLVAPLDQLPHGFERAIEPEVLDEDTRRFSEFTNGLFQLTIQFILRRVARRNLAVSKPVDHREGAAHEIAETVGQFAID